MILTESSDNREYVSVDTGSLGTCMMRLICQELQYVADLKQCKVKDCCDN